jgi:hypothetical protein|tara:strand:+ start:632 stop:1036 length:405 start_codon:yes stop_codon:yes gene_type:complete
MCYPGWVGGFMSWKRKRRLQGKNKYYSLAKKLRREQRSSDEFEIMLNQLTLEEVIGLKLELATKSVNGKLFGVPLWYSLHNVVQDAVLKYTFSASRTNGEAMRYLGLKKAEMKKLLKKYNIDNYFSEKEIEDEI